ncbi:MAG: ABC transporter substrate-binding protein [Patescibacteria group bacterium]
MNSIIKVVIAIVVLIVLIWGISALVSKDAKPAEVGTYKIGFILPLTGDAAAYGEPGRNVYALAVEEINKSGGVNGKQLEAIYEDGKCSGKDAANAMQKLANVDKVQIVIGGFCSGESLAAIPIAETAKVALFSPGSSSPDLTGKSPYFFRNYPSDATQGRVLAELAYNVKKWKKVAVIQEQSDYALGNYKAFSENFNKLGGTTVKEEFPSDTTDFKTILTKLKNQNPEALFVDPQTPANTERILKQLSDLKWKPALLMNDISIDMKLVEGNKAILEGAFAAEFGVDPTNPKFARMAEVYKSKHVTDVPFPSYAQTEYDAVFLIADAIKAVGYGGEKIAAWSRTVKDWSGASGNTTIEQTGDRAGGHVPKVIKDGKVELFVQ